MSSLTMDSPHDLLAQLSAKAAENAQIGESTEQQELPNNNNDNADEASPSPDIQQSHNFDIDAQQKALQRLMGNLGPFRNPFGVNCLPPFLAALQQNPLQLQQQLLGLATGSGVSPCGDEDEDTENINHIIHSVEPEDLTIGFRKEKKDGDDVHDLTPTGAGQPSWSYEEQFKQLYELSDDIKRKEWLDDWLSFMHRIGKPVTRIPIMAKQVLDLYELYRLVVQHGGLVEIINKKLWREITKGLNLPSSITSAAFTLRTQYQKYLYDYECEKEGLSNPSDLQAAIDGNRREGRRNASASQFGPLGYTLGPPPGASLLGKHPLNGALNLRNDFMDEDPSGLCQPNPLLAAYRAEQFAMFDMHNRQFQNEFRAAADAIARQNLGLAGLVPQPHPSGRESTSSADSSDHSAAKRARLSMVQQANDDVKPAPSASGTAIALPTTNIKISNSKDGENKSMVVSIEVNGVTYQGVLFALNGDTVDARA